MRICIFGAGVIGGILANACANAGHDVSVIARGPHLQAILDNGLTIVTPNGAQVTHPKASENPADLGVQDLVIVCTKTPALGEVAKAIAPLLDANTQVVFSLNGIFWFYGDGFTPGGEKLNMDRLDPEGTLHSVIGAERSLGLIAWAGGEIKEPGVVTARSAGRFVLGHALSAQASKAEKLAADLGLSDVTIETVPEVRIPMWVKFMAIAGNFATSALTGGNIGQVQGDAACLEVSIGLQGEANALAKAHGFSEIPFDADKLRANPGKIPHKPSMLQDLERGRVMEIESAYLITQDLAKQAGLPMPYHDVVVPLLTLRARLAGCYEA